MKELIFSTLIFMFSADVFAAYGDMDPGTCSPSGLVNKAKEKLNPRGFWARMDIDSERAIENLSGRRTDEQWDGPESQCMLDNKAGSSGYYECMMEMRNMLEYWIKCNRHAKIMCRMHGGNC